MSEGKKGELWQKSLSYIKARIEETAFQTWFEVVKINDFDEESITLIVPNTP